jgi:hypothetical protein
VRLGALARFVQELLGSMKVWGISELRSARNEGSRQFCVIDIANLAANELA